MYQNIISWDKNKSEEIQKKLDVLKTGTSNTRNEKIRTSMERIASERFLKSC